MILVVEDEQYRRNWFTKAFTEQKIHFATNLDKCLDLLKENTYDIIFLGYDLSEDTNGQDIALAMTYLKPNLETPIIIHATNANAAAKMKHVLQEVYTDVARLPFQSLAGERYWIFGDKEN